MFLKSIFLFTKFAADLLSIDERAFNSFDVIYVIVVMIFSYLLLLVGYTCLTYILTTLLFYNFYRKVEVYPFKTIIIFFYSIYTF